MFTKDDYINYFNEIEGIFKKNLEIYTDLLNELSDQAIRNKLFMLAEEDMETFTFIEEAKRKYFERA
jgi:formiminotetrahydrofolate cyclodeaminase